MEKDLLRDLNETGPKTLTHVGEVTGRVYIYDGDTSDLLFYQPKKQMDDKSDFDLKRIVVLVNQICGICEIDEDEILIAYKTLEDQMMVGKFNLVNQIFAQQNDKFFCNTSDPIKSLDEVLAIDHEKDEFYFPTKMGVAKADLQDLEIVQVLDLPGQVEKIKLSNDGESIHASSGRQLFVISTDSMEVLGKITSNETISDFKGDKNQILTSFCKYSWELYDGQTYKKIKSSADEEQPQPKVQFVNDGQKLPVGFMPCLGIPFRGFVGITPQQEQPQMGKKAEPQEHEKQIDLREGKLFRIESYPGTYLAVDGVLRWIPNQSTFANLFTKDAEITDFSKEYFEICQTGPNIDDGALLFKGDGANQENVYLLLDGKKRLIANKETFGGFNFDQNAIKIMPQIMVDAVPTGNKLQII